VVSFRRRGKEAAAAAVRPLATPEVAVRTWLCFVERDEFASIQFVAATFHADITGGNDEAISGAATPFSGGILVVAARNPAVV
jgi:hypothetical protein